MSILRFILHVFTIVGAMCHNITCLEKDKYEWCKTLDRSLCSQGIADNYTLQSSCPETCGCWGDTSCCYDSKYCTPGIVSRSGTCCMNENGWCWDGSDNQGNMHGVCCNTNETCSHYGSIHGQANCKPLNK